MKKLFRAIGLFTLVAWAPLCAHADGVPPIVPVSGVLFGSSQKLITSSTTAVNIDTTTFRLNANKGVKTSTLTFNDGTVLTSTNSIQAVVSWGAIQGTLSNQSDLQTKFNAVGTSTAALQTSVTSLGVSTAALSASITSLGASTGTLASSIATLGVATGTIQSQVTVNTSSIATLSASTTSLQSQVTTNTASIATLTTSTTSLQSQINGLPTISANNSWSGQNSWTTLKISTFTGQVVVGSMTIQDLIASQFIKTDANKHLIGYNLYGDTITWTGGQNVASPFGLGVQYGVSAGSVVIQGLAGPGPLRGQTGVAVSTGPTILSSEVTGILPVANGGSGSASPSLIAGANASITGSWPNQTISALSGGASALGVYNGTTLISSPTIAVGGDSTTIISYAVGSSSAGFKVNIASVTVMGNTFNIANRLVQLTSGGQYPSADGNLITNLNAANVNGTLSINNGTINNFISNLITASTETISSSTITNASISALTVGSTLNGQTPGDIAGANITITGTWPAQTINANGITSILGSTNTWTGQQNWTSASPSTFSAVAVTKNLTMVAGSTITNTSSTQPFYFNSPNYGHLRLSGTFSYLTTSYVEISPTQMVFSNPIAGSNGNGWTVGHLASTNLIAEDTDAGVCSDFSTTCISDPIIIGAPGIGTLSGNMMVDANHAYIGTISQANSRLAVAGTTLIGTGYLNYAAMPTNSLVVVNKIIAGTTSSTTVNTLSTQFGLIGNTANTYEIYSSTSNTAGVYDFAVSTLGVVSIPKLPNALLATDPFGNIISTSIPASSFSSLLASTSTWTGANTFSSATITTLNTGSINNAAGTIAFAFKGGSFNSNLTFTSSSSGFDAYTQIAPASLADLQLRAGASSHQIRFGSKASFQGAVAAGWTIEEFTDSSQDVGLSITNDNGNTRRRFINFQSIDGSDVNGGNIFYAPSNLYFETDRAWVFESPKTSTVTYGLQVGTLTVTGIIGAGTVSVSTGTGAGTVGSPTASIAGTNSFGKLTLNTATAPGTSAVAVTVTPSIAMPTAWICSLTPANSTTSLLSGATMVNVTSTSSTWVINSGGTGLTGSSTYVWNYTCGGY